MRFRFLIIALIPICVIGQKSKNELVTIEVEDMSLEAILDSVSEQTNYFFSYNSELFPKGSRYTIDADSEPVDQFLSRLLVGTDLKYSFFKDQIILNYQPPEEQVIRKKKFFTISGKVQDEKGQPISGVNIFLDGTSIGSFSDIDGNFMLQSIPPGYYDLVFSHIGYENASYSLTEYNGGSRIQNHQLVFSPQELEEVNVVAKRTSMNEEDWNIYYQAFKQEVLGKSWVADQCVIENPEVISFTVGEGDQLIAKADDVIIIRNDALGYRIDYFLESFERNADDLRFRGKMRFRNQNPASSKEKREWKKNRKISYRGSFNHFKKSLLADDLRKQGFRMYGCNRLTAIKESSRKKELTKNDILVYKGDGYELSFANSLIVEYRKEKETSDFLNENEFVGSYYEDYITKNGFLVKDPGNQISVIRLLKSPVRIDPTGQIVDRFAVSTYGYWSWERVGDLVPINYEPKWDKF